MPWGLKRFQNTGDTHFVTFSCYQRHAMFTTPASRRLFESALERVRGNFRLRVYAYVVMPEHVHLLLSEPQPEGAPFKPAFGLSGEGHTKSDALHAGRCIEVLEAGSLAPPDQRRPAFLAKALLRSQHSRSPAACGEDSLHPSQPGQAWIVSASGRLGVEQLSPLRHRMRRTRADRIRVDRKETRARGG
jgi:Transposase IS200 like